MLGIWVFWDSGSFGVQLPRYPALPTWRSQCRHVLRAPGHHLSCKNHLGYYNSDLLSLRNTGFFSAYTTELSLEWLGRHCQNILFMWLDQCLKPKANFKWWSIEIPSSFILSGRSGSTSYLWRVADTGDAQLCMHPCSPATKPVTAAQLGCLLWQQPRHCSCLFPCLLSLL